ncbi:nucleoside kinase [Parabacteroides sp. FAFU027]|uniref:nucleoside kinase n=1 Tax=Parabacteroides sp. FAFU027 TaxID=2922715 RepID=UPI001FAF9FC9|nr:nucleoside kinase [Parabacteroides sp. FAFU027]
MYDTVRIYCKNTNEFRDFPVGVTLLDIYNELEVQTPYLVVSAKVNNRVEGLRFRVFTSKNVEFIDLTNSSGMRTYVRSLCFVLYKAMAEIFPGSKLRIEHPISKGYFCKMELGADVCSDKVSRIKRRMQEIIDEDLHFHRKEAQTEEVVRLFELNDMMDKAELLASTGEVYSSYYQLGEHINYFYGNLVPSTGYLYLFDLICYEDGVLLRIPNRDKPTILEDIVPQKKMLDIFHEYNRFNEILGFSDVATLNQASKSGEATDIIKVSEALHEKKISHIADEIAAKSSKIILIAGPSSSGKTTFTKRLSIELMTNLLKPVSISLDNYFIERDKTPLDEHGEHDFESLYALDLELFNKDLNDLLEGKEIAMPTFSFEQGKRQYKGNKLRLHENNILLIEGIHGLNPELTPHIPDELKYRIYVSALTTISLDDHNWIPTTDNRLLRRIIRDFKYRNYSARNTIARWPSVRRGEEKWIFPFQENADAMFNSALLFELAVLKRYVEPLLMAVPQNCDEYSEATRLLRFLSYFYPIYDREIPPTSLIREFLGGSSFRY